MKKSSQIILLASFIMVVFSCTHKRYSQASVNNNKTIAATGNKATEPYFLFISDIHLDISLKKTDSTTDTGMDLWNIFKIKIDSILGSPTPPAFVICTGDLPAHYKCDDGSCLLTGDKLQKHNNELSTVLTDLRNLVTKYKIPLYYIPGNNDALSGDYYSFANGNQQMPFSLAPDSHNPYPALNISATGDIAPYILSMPNPSMGYYSAFAIPGLRVIALNSVIFGNKYESVDGISQTDAGNQEMTWLTNQLNDAKNKGDKVYIAMHIPPGTDAYKFDRNKTPYTTWAVLPSAENSWLKTFLRLANDYQSTIAGILYGHTHMDELRLLYDSTGSHLTEVAISAPGITPQHGNNPGFKTVSFDPVSMALTNFTTYYTTLPVTGSWGNDTYSFSAIFNNKAGVSIYDFINLQSAADIKKGMDQIYTVMHGHPAYNITSGMLVNWK
jgi:sphingomyelin phosphodiesterase acid-like 3